LFDNIQTITIDETLMLKAGVQLQQLRSQGIEMPVTAARVAQVAIGHGVSVLSLDPSFKHLNVTLVEV
jgi:hypothetical protein